ncbi:GDSL-type esterase/lipase family protein [Guptibacillus hwajinpoensis]|uniref:GDSL-type esterase/lipase family protein n=1 Tax=Guptibacillus hwajinpoensis TaxID=208199 RepID=UPI003D6C2FE7
MYLENLSKGLKEVRELNKEAPIYFLGLFNPFSKAFGDIPEIDGIVKEWNEGSKEIASQYHDVTFVPIADIFLDTEENLLYKDAFHPNDEGYDLMGNRVVYYLKENKVVVNQ